MQIIKKELLEESLEEIKSLCNYYANDKKCGNVSLDVSFYKGGISLIKINTEVTKK